MAKRTGPKNQAIRLLEGKNIAYETRGFDFEVYVSAEEVAKAISMPPEQVFKTLVTEPEKGIPLLAVIPAHTVLDLKALAKAVSVKKVRMASQANAESLTGLKKGGISALTLVNRGFRILLDESALSYTRIAMSAGERGAQVLLAPADFLQVTNAQVAAIARFEL